MCPMKTMSLLSLHAVISDNHDTCQEPDKVIFVKIEARRNDDFPFLVDQP